LATRSGGPEDLIAHEDNGLLIRNEDPQALADALARVMGDEALRRHFQARAPHSVAERNMSAPAMIAAYEALYGELLSR
jgi:glycosyltransferase involved in cell wall biosynthesis